MDALGFIQQLERTVQVPTGLADARHDDAQALRVAPLLGELGRLREGQQQPFGGLQVTPLTVQLTEAPAETQVASRGTNDAVENASVSNVKLGISVEPIPVELARQANLDAEARGLLVREVNLDGPANQQLVARTDVIAEVLRPAPRRAVKTVADLERALSRVRDGDIVSLYVYNIGARRDGSEPQGRVVNLRVGGTD